MGSNGNTRAHCNPRTLPKRVAGVHCKRLTMHSPKQLQTHTLVPATTKNLAQQMPHFCADKDAPF